MPIIRNHRILYLITISTFILLVGLNQWLNHLISKHQEQKSFIVSLVHEQQLLSQRLAWLSAQIQLNDQVDSYWNELMEVEQNWSEVHRWLIIGSPNVRSPNVGSPSDGNFQEQWLPAEGEIRELLLQVEPEAQGISTAVQALFLEFEEDKFDKALETIQRSVLEYNRGMKSLIIALEMQASQQQLLLQKIQAALIFLSVLVFWLEYYLIIRPAFKYQERQHQLLHQSFLEKESMNQEMITLETRLRHTLNIQKAISDNLKDAKKHAEQASQEKGNYLSTMSHEIRTPLNSIIGITHLLLDQQAEANRVENLEALYFSAQNLKSLINNILDLSKIEAGRIDLEQEPFNVHEVVQGVYQSMRILADEKELPLKLEVDNRIPQFVRGDATRLSQILNNLVSNAIKFTLAGHVSIRLKQVNENDECITIRFEVEDSGIGISADKVDTIFEEFAQAERDTTRKFGGTGLGLAITKKLLQLLGSDIEVSSVPNKGTTFSFQLTVEPVILSIQDQDLQLVKVTQDTISGMRVLVAEDNKLNIIVLRQFLKKWGVLFDEAVNGREALALAKKESYDVILMDVQMPVMDGLTASEKIRKEGIKVPIVALTASAFTEIREELRQAGITDFTTKPFIPEALFETLAKYHPSATLIQNTNETAFRSDS